MKILILGGHGFIGRNVAQLLKESEHKILSLSRRDGFDLKDFSSTKENLEKVNPDIIINCAAHVGSLHYIAEHSAEVVDDNLQMTLNLYRAVKEVCPNVKIINLISNCSYPGESDIQIESKWWDGPVHQSVWSFANAKRMLAVVSDCYHSQYSIKSVNFIVPNAYGPGDYTDPNRTHALNGMIIRMIKAQREKLPEFEIWGTGNPQREWIYVTDLAKMLGGNIKKENQISPINIAQNKAYSIRETAEKIKEIIGYEGRITFNTNYKDGALIKKLDDKLFREEYPEFNFTDIDEGIRKTVNYYKEIL